MTITKTLVEAFAEEYSEVEIRAWRKAAMAAVAANLPRVEITSSNFKDGGSGGEFIDADPAELVELFTAVLRYLSRQAELAAGASERGNQQVSFADFRLRRWGS
jgi:hypothetical protein